MRLADSQVTELGVLHLDAHADLRDAYEGGLARILGGAETTADADTGLH